MTQSKKHISSDELLMMSYRLAVDVYDSSFNPNYIVGVWRGGAPVGIAVQELLKKLGVDSDHIAIRTSSYTGINKRDKQVHVHGLSYITERVTNTDRLLLVDDVFDTGLSLAQVIAELKDACGQNMPQVRIATPFFKPANNKTNLQPDFYIEPTDKWLVFPHEVCDLTYEEIAGNKPELYRLLHFRGLLEQ